MISIKKGYISNLSTVSVERVTIIGVLNFNSIFNYLNFKFNIINMKNDSERRLLALDLYHIIYLYSY